MITLTIFLFLCQLCQSVVLNQKPIVPQKHPKTLIFEEKVKGFTFKVEIKESEPTQGDGPTSSGVTASGDNNEDHAPLGLRWNHTTEELRELTTQGIEMLEALIDSIKSAKGARNYENTILPFLKYERES